MSPSQVVACDYTIKISQNPSNISHPVSVLLSRCQDLRWQQLGSWESCHEIWEIIWRCCYIPRLALLRDAKKNWGVPIFAPSPNEDANISSVSAAAEHLSLLFQISSGSLKCCDVNQQLARSTGQAFRSRWGWWPIPSRIMNWPCMSTLVRYHRTWPLWVWHVWINSCVKYESKYTYQRFQRFIHTHNIMIHTQLLLILYKHWGIIHQSQPSCLGGNSRDDHPLGCHHELQASI